MPDVFDADVAGGRGHLHVSHFAVYPLMLLPCAVAGIHFLFPWLFIVHSGVSQLSANAPAASVIVRE
jgi:hypothetical protein